MNKKPPIKMPLSKATHTELPERNRAWTVAVMCSCKAWMQITCVAEPAAR